MYIKTSFLVQLYPKNGEESPNGYYICIYRNLENKKKITCKGYNLPRRKLLQYKMQVKESTDNTRGMQYEMISYEDYVEASEDSILQYLSSGIIKGIGTKTAEKIYKRFGDKTMEIFENEIDRLLEVPGITQPKLEKIKKSYKEKRQHKELTTYLLKYDFTLTNIKNIIYEFEGDALQKIKENPYELIHINGIDFYKIEPIAKNMNIEPDDYRRIKAGAIQVLKNSMSRGNTCMGITNFLLDLVDLLRTSLVNERTVQSYIVRMIKERVIFYRKATDKQGVLKEYIFHASCVQAEHDIAKNVVRMLKEEKKQYKNIKKDIVTYSTPLILDETQVDAINTSITEPISIITGGPGTGKSTIIRILCDIYEKYNPQKDIILISPTGRAARRMEECSNRTAHTIHHILKLGLTGENENIFNSEEVEIENCLVIVDEFSMVDSFIAQKLFGSIKNCQLVLVGDSDQLESVGPGAVLKELLKSNAIPTTKLNCRHRQEKGSLIPFNAEQMKEGKGNFKYGEDFVFVEESEMNKIEELMVNAYIREVEEHGIENVLCLCPFKEYAAGINRMNKILQEKLNSKGKRWDATEREFRIGDPVMHLRNTDEVSNGDIGYISNFLVKDNEPVMEVIYFNRYQKYYKVEDLIDITLAYAMTVHKSQGSEAKCVITCFTEFHRRTLKSNLKRNLPYTAITRGKKKVVLFGNVTAIEAAIKNNQERTTLLAHEIGKQLKALEEKKNVIINKEVKYTQLKMAL